MKLPWKLLSIDQLRNKPRTTVLIWIYSQTLESIETWSVVGIHNVLFSTFFSLGARHDGYNKNLRIHVINICLKIVNGTIWEDVAINSLFAGCGTNRWRHHISLGRRTIIVVTIVSCTQTEKGRKQYIMDAHDWSRFDTLQCLWVKSVHGR
jgi:hypothetical protein